MQAGTAESQAFDATLDRALDHGWKNLHLVAECNTEKGWLAVEAFSSGVAIWNQTTQIHLSEEQIKEQLRILRQAEFSSMQELYGGGEPQRVEEENAGAAMQIICRVALDLDGAHKQAAQRAKGKRSAELAQLAADLFAVCEKPARSGLKADDLADGLNKLGDGKLAPETWYLLLNLKPETPDGSGFLLRVDGSQASSQKYEASSGLGQPHVLELSQTELEALVKVLSASQMSEMPINLYAEDYTDFGVSVLNQRKKIQARQFAGLTPTQHGEHQERFDRLIGELTALHEKIVAKGQVGGES